MTTGQTSESRGRRDEARRQHGPSHKQITCHIWGDPWVCGAPSMRYRVQGIEGLRGKSRNEGS